MDGFEICLFCYKTSESAKQNINGEVSRFITLLERFTNPLESEAVNFVHGSKLLGCCNLCGVIVDGFCDEFHRMKCLEMKLEWKLGRIVGIMELAGRVPSRLLKLQQLFEHGNLSHRSSGTSDNSLEFLKNYRQKIIKRCKNRLSSSQPRLLLKRVDTLQKMTEHSKIADISCPAEGDTLTHFLQNGMPDVTNIKLEQGSSEILDQDDENVIVRVKIVNPEHDQNTQSDEENDSDREDMDSQELETSLEDPNPASPETQIEIKIEPVENKVVSRQTSPKLGPPLPCEQCGKTFLTKIRLRDHLRRVHVQAKFQCPACKKLFKTSNNLNLHCKETKHKTPKASKIFQCSKCLESCATQWLLDRHIVRVHKIHSCKECGQEFKSPFLLNQHLMKVHKYPGPTAQYQCHICDRKFLNKYFLTEHLHSTHKLGIPMPCDQCGKCFLTKHRLAMHIKRVHTQRSHECSVCKKMFKEKRHLLTHQKIHDKPTKVKVVKAKLRFTCPDCPKTFKSQDNLTKHQKSHSSSEAACKFCPQTFPTRIHLARHVRLKHVNKGDCKLIKCSKCESQFLTQKLLDRHILTAHNTLSDNPCTKCGKTFPTKLRLNVHMKRVHVLPTHSCDKCDKIFKVRHQLVQHKKSHNKPIKPTSVEKAVCQFCQAIFPSRHSLALHVRLDHLNKGDVPDAKLFKCSKCDSQFLIRRMLLYHLRTVHITAKYQCPKCGMRFKRKDSLSSHEARHEEKKIQCNECGKMFSNQKVLGSHRRTHHGPKIAAGIICQFCGKTYSSRHSMSKHLYAMHKDKGKPGLHLINYATQFEQEEGNNEKQTFATEENPISQMAHVEPPTVEINSHEIGPETEEESENFQSGHENDWSDDDNGNELEHILEQPRVEPKLENENVDELEEETGDVSCLTFPVVPVKLEPEQSESSRQYSLRQKKRISYKQMEGGNEQTSESSDEDASLASERDNNFSDGTSSDFEEETESSPTSGVKKSKQKSGADNLIEIHEHTSPVECDRCDQTFPSKSLLHEYQYSTHKIRIACEKCGKYFLTEQVLETHMKRVHVKRTHQCLVCKHAFKTNRDLVRHEQTHKDLEKVNVKIVPCNQCDKTFSTKLRLYVHKRRLHSGSQLECSVCKTVVNGKENLKKHLLLHTDAGTWKNKCDLCGKRFSQNNLLSQHKKVCGKPSTRKRPTSKPKIAKAVKREVSKFEGKFIVHQGENNKPRYECKECPGKLWNFKGDLEKHLLTHENGEPLVCQFCGSKHPHSRALQRHVRKYHNGNNQITYVPRSRMRTRKKVVKKNPKAEKFTEKFVVHEGVGEDKKRTYECMECPGKLWNNKGDLDKHLLSHEKEEPLICQFCGSEHENSRALQSHVRKHHRYENKTDK